jgi:hypothetical protein
MKRELFIAYVHRHVLVRLQKLPYGTTALFFFFNFLNNFNVTICTLYVIPNYVYNVFIHLYAIFSAMCDYNMPSQSPTIKVVTNHSFLTRWSEV